MNFSSLILYLKKPDLDGIIQAEMSKFPFDGILEEPLKLVGYIESSSVDIELTNYFTQRYPELIERVALETIPDKNWNEEWEKGFKEVRVGKFCQIRASFHEQSQDCDYSIVINPKMAFGTGHHETTCMMIESMETLDFEGKKVFDFGCGTGILAILAAKLGAKHILGIDNEVPAIENSEENSVLNEVNTIVWSINPIEEIIEQDFDIILANINRNVLLEYMSLLVSLLNKRGILVLSGVLSVDEKLMLEAISKAELETIEIKKKGEWVCISARHLEAH